MRSKLAAFSKAFAMWSDCHTLGSSDSSSASGRAQVVSSKNVADALGRVLRLPMELELDLGLVAIVWFEPDDAFVRRARDAPPRDDTVGLLLIDLCVPFLDSAPDARAPMQPLVV